MVRSVNEQRPSDSCLWKLSSTWCFKIIRRTARRCRKTIRAFRSRQQAMHVYYISCFWCRYLTGAHCRYFGMWRWEDSRKYQWLSLTFWWELNYRFRAGLKPTSVLPSCMLWRWPVADHDEQSRRHIYFLTTMAGLRGCSRHKWSRVWGTLKRGGSFIALCQLSVKVALITLKRFWKL